MATIAKSSPSVVVAIGDSIIEGKSALLGRGWVHHVVGTLRGAKLLKKYTNNASGGYTIIDVHEHILPDCVDLQPDLVFFGVGVNDSRFRPSRASAEVSLEKFSQYVKDTLSIILKSTRSIVIVSGQVPVIDELVNPYKPDKHYSRANQIPYDSALRSACENTRVRFLDNFSRWSSYGEDYIARHMADGLHPSTPGHREIAEAAIKLLNDEGIIRY